MNREIFVGYTENGSRMYVEITLRPLSERMSVTHESVKDGVELSICGALYEHRTMISGGQNLDDLLDITRPARGWTLEEINELHAIWQRWHLNGMRAECAHMELPEERSYNARKDIRCSVSSYYYGTDWLYEPLPEQIIERVKFFQRRLRPRHAEEE